MIPAGYMAKRVQKLEGFNVDRIADVYSVSSCVNDKFADYIDYWKHNGYRPERSIRQSLGLTAYSPFIP